MTSEQARRKWRWFRRKPAKAERVIEELKSWSPIAAEVDTLFALAKESLGTVTALTEYEDSKAGRLITGIALLSAAAGAIYAAMLKDILPVVPVAARIRFNYAFFVYEVVNVIGVFLLLSAIYPWFNIPRYWKRRAKAPGPPASMLFGPQIAKASPEAWVEAFKTPGSLKTRYLKDYIHETYLIAEKIKRKYTLLRCALIFVLPANLLLLPIWLVYCLYLNMKSVTRSPTTTAIVEMPAAASDFSDYTCFVVLDADNTLWDTDRLYAEAQLAMLSDICAEIGIAPKLEDPLKFVRDIDQSIAASHPSDLKYPPGLLADGLIKALLKIAGRPEKSLKNKRALVKKAAEAYLRKIREIPKLRAGVREGLYNLRKLGARAVICSEGVNESLLRNLNDLGVLSYVEKVVVAPKSTDVFRHLSDEFNPYRKLQFCVGDQLDRDIQNAKSAGYKTVYFPGNFRPNWLPELDAIKPDLTIDSLALLPEKIKALKAAAAQPNAETKLK
jgi:putative hydrolase of the HAD superfamily